MFYCITVYKNNVFYLPELDAITIAEIKDQQLYLLDIFSKREQNLDQVIDNLIDQTINMVKSGFVPKDCSSWEIMPVDEKEKDEMLFIEIDKTTLFDENQLMFPVLSHA